VVLKEGTFTQELSVMLIDDKNYEEAITGTISISDISDGLEMFGYTTFTFQLQGTDANWEPLHSESIKPVEVYPVPTDGIINIVSESEVQSVELLSIDGPTLETPALREGQIDLAKYPSGLYIIRLKVKGNYQEQTIIKQ